MLPKRSEVKTKGLRPVVGRHYRIVSGALEGWGGTLVTIKGNWQMGEERMYLVKTDAGQLVEIKASLIDVGLLDGSIRQD